MPKKPKFRPRITRIKLNPEQAVLACNCFNSNWNVIRVASGSGYALGANPFPFCSGKGNNTYLNDRSVGDWYYEFSTGNS